MTTKFFRRDVLAGAGGFVAGMLAVTLASEPFSVKPQQPVADLLPKAPAVAPVFAELATGSFQHEFQKISLRPVGRDDFWLVAEMPSVTAPRASRSWGTFDLPRREPWVAPYAFLIEPAQAH